MTFGGNDPYNRMTWGKGPRTGDWDLGHGRQTEVLNAIALPSDAEVEAAARYLDRVGAADVAEMLGVTK